MHFKQKLAFFVFGCVFVIVGQVVTGLVVPPADAQEGLQDAEFDTISARTLWIEHPDGGSMKLWADGGAHLWATDASGGFSFQMLATSSEASVRVGDRKGGTGVWMQDSDVENALLAVTRGDETQALLGITENGGSVTVQDKYGEPEAGFGVNASGDGFVHP